MYKVMNALDLSLKPLTLPCSSSVFLAAYYLCIPGPLRASGSVSLPKIATPVKCFVNRPKRAQSSPKLFSLYPHTLLVQHPMRRRKGEGGASTLRRAGPTAQSADCRTQGQRRRCSPGDGLPAARGYRLSFLCGKRGTRKLRLFRFPPPLGKHTSFSMRASFAPADGLPETENNAGEPENTYILRPIFQQRRVEDGLWRRRPARLLPAPG